MAAVGSTHPVARCFRERVFNDGDRATSTRNLSEPFNRFDPLATLLTRVRKTRNCFAALRRDGSNLRRLSHNGKRSVLVDYWLSARDRGCDSYCPTWVRIAGNALRLGRCFVLPIQTNHLSSRRSAA